MLKCAVRVSNHCRRTRGTSPAPLAGAGKTPHASNAAGSQNSRRFMSKLTVSDRASDVTCERRPGVGEGATQGCVDQFKERRGQPCWFVESILVGAWLKLAERAVMRSRAIHRTDLKPHRQTVAERRLNFRVDSQSSLRDGHLTMVSTSQQPCPRIANAGTTRPSPNRQIPQTQRSALRAVRQYAPDTVTDSSGA